MLEKYVWCPNVLLWRFITKCVSNDNTQTKIVYNCCIKLYANFYLLWRYYHVLPYLPIFLFISILDYVGFPILMLSYDGIICATDTFLDIYAY